MRQNPHVRICGGPGSATTLVYPTGSDPRAHLYLAGQRPQADRICRLGPDGSAVCRPSIGAGRPDVAGANDSGRVERPWRALTRTHPGRDGVRPSLARIRLNAFRRASCVIATRAVPPRPHASEGRRPGHDRAQPEGHLRDDDERGGDRPPRGDAQRQERHTQQTDPQKQRQAHQDDTRESPEVADRIPSGRRRRRGHHEGQLATRLGGGQERLSTIPADCDRSDPRRVHHGHPRHDSLQSGHLLSHIRQRTGRVARLSIVGRHSPPETRTSRKTWERAVVPQARAIGSTCARRLKPEGQQRAARPAVPPARRRAPVRRRGGWHRAHPASRARPAARLACSPSGSRR